MVPPGVPPLSSPAVAPSGEKSGSYELFSKFCGVSFGKLRSVDANDINPGTGKARKIVSGDHASAGSEVQQQVLWPNRALSSLVVPSPPEFKSLTPAQFAAGESAILLTELPIELQGSPLAHRLMHLNKLFTYSFSYDWQSCLNLHKSFLQSIEHGHSSWVSWPPISEWHRLHLENIRPSSKVPEKPKASNQKTDKEKVHGIDVKFMRDSKLCINFQSNRCDQDPGHTSPGGRTELSHSCAICLFKLKVVSDHCAAECPKKEKVFPKGARPGSDRN